MVSALVLAISLGAADPSWPFADRREQFGGVLAPALMPNGALSVFGNAGFPDVDAAFRQGFDGFEVEGRAFFDYYRVTVGVELAARAFRFQTGALELAPSLAIGVAQNLGSSYFDPLNTFYFAARVRAGLLGTLRLSPTVQGLFKVDLPFERALSIPNAFRFFPTGGIGAEVYLVEDVSVSVLGRAGGEVLVQDSLINWRPTFAIQFGLGFRLF